MTEHHPKSILVSMRANELRGRGAVYKWLNKNYRSVTRGFERTESSWAGVIDAMVAGGVTNREGGRPSANSVLKVWQRVCEDRAARARKAKRKQPARSQSSGTWQPPLAKGPPGRGKPAQALSSRPQADPAAALPQRSTDPAEDLPDHAKAAFASIRRQFAHVDRHIIQSTEED